MIQTSPCTKVIRLEGAFDCAAAQRLACTLAQTDASEPIVIDLTHVTELQDCSVLVLAQALADRGERLTVRGLRQHHLRLLRYLGVERVGELGAT